MFASLPYPRFGCQRQIRTQNHAGAGRARSAPKRKVAKARFPNIERRKNGDLARPISTNGYSLEGRESRGDCRWTRTARVGLPWLKNGGGLQDANSKLLLGLFLFVIKVFESVVFQTDQIVVRAEALSGVFHCIEQVDRLIFGLKNSDFLTLFEKYVMG